ncbi:hypothetical protein GMORB2_0834 [Geosmithia morbida]|uniref:Uncharacterized protein n=1 Tax=Geosmithia morbida TaxID=1094350 RepID=A0A9P4Z0S8_9HYPO|nr:uncharacterized protein GMORB2_0834 [Geosmithia morbida]KAF4125590.1 hypothetical protein GMORB2_0834 [Geosmithia morbida]
MSLCTTRAYLHIPRLTTAGKPISARQNGLR